MSFIDPKKLGTKRPNLFWEMALPDVACRDARPKGVDLFAGAGGFSLGARLAGIDIVAAVEKDKHACTTYEWNLIHSGVANTRLFSEDILKLDPGKFMSEAGLKPGECQVLLGGPPCQGFSAHRLNGSGIDDPRNKLLLRYFEYVRALRPAFFIVENVPGMLWPRHKAYVEEFRRLAI
ncbi:DNA cytosine methyltransferase [Magnetospirillum sp. J10]|uniref:DNA (cytosine-5-)-methyltransferase n=1 Tax=Magnetospirillum sulfuroxidans TaxID=611300 RepID=A0ABS5IBX4_9PROT|nr:DNA cytosine methyltransferase [Magnetospirillum sulfuroxidans]